MRDAIVDNSWDRQSHRAVAFRGALRELNQRFLSLFAAHVEWPACRRIGLSADILGRLAPLSPQQKEAAADCPYALFDLRFRDDDYWAECLTRPVPWRIADETAADDALVDFVNVVLFFAWHVASSDALSARLLLGMNEQTVDVFRRARLDRLPALAASEAVHLTARWSYCHAYWVALARSAAGRGGADLRRIQLYGLQLAAAARLN